MRHKFHKSLDLGAYIFVKGEFIVLSFSTYRVLLHYNQRRKGKVLSYSQVKDQVFLTFHQDDQVAS